MTRRASVPDHDLIIVGGGPAGLSTLLHLGRHDPALAERTLLLERDHYPRDKYCAGGLGGRGVGILAALGVGVDVPRVPLAGARLAFDGYEATLREPGFGYVVRRLAFDHHLARTAMDRGLAVRDGARVESVRETADGVTVRLVGGEELTARAVVGADGVGGVVRRSAGFSGGTLRAQVIELDTEAVEGDPPRDLVHFDVQDATLGGYAWDFPTLVGDTPMMCRGVYLIRPLGPANVHDRLRRYLDAKGLDMRRYKLKPFGERGLDRSEPLSRPRVLLAGEAAGIDIATGEGIAQALEYGRLAARYVSRHMRRGDVSFADWSAVVRRSPLGLGLYARLLAYRLYYHHRARATRLFEADPAILHLYAHHFAGNRVSARTLASMVRHAPLTELPWAIRAMLAPPTRPADPSSATD